MIPTIRASDFVKRQVEDSSFAHFDGTWERVEQLAERHFDEATPGYREGVCLVPVPPEGFYSSVVEVDEGTTLVADFEARRKGEEGHVSVHARGEKVPGRKAELVLYRADVLAEGNERSTSADWEIVSVNVSPVDESLPMHPVTMARNFLVKEGGTKGEYTPEQFAEAIWFWSQHANVE